MQRAIDKLLSFSMEDMFDADKRRRQEYFIEDCCHLWAMGLSETDPKWLARYERLGQWIDCGIKHLDEYQDEILKEMRNEE